jgi:hypothetical protein
LATLVFSDGEIAEARFVDRAEIDTLTVPRLARRLLTALDASRDGRTVYAEHGGEPSQ